MLPSDFAYTVSKFKPKGGTLMRRKRPNRLTGFERLLLGVAVIFLSVTVLRTIQLKPFLQAQQTIQTFFQVIYRSKKPSKPSVLLQKKKAYKPYFPIGFQPSHPKPVNRLQNLYHHFKRSPPLRRAFFQKMQIQRFMLLICPARHL